MSDRGTDLETLRNTLEQLMYEYHNSHKPMEGIIESYNHMLSSLSYSFGKHMQAKSDFTTQYGYTEIATLFKNIEIATSPYMSKAAHKDAPDIMSIASIPSNAHNIASLDYSSVLQFIISLKATFFPHTKERDDRIIRIFEKWEKAKDYNEELAILDPMIDGDNPLKFSESPVTKESDINTPLSLHIPTLLGSSECSLTHMTSKLAYEVGESPHEIGGQFSENGKEYVVRSLSSFPQNPPIVDPQYNRHDVLLKIMIRSQADEMFGPVQESTPIVTTRDGTELMKIHLSKNATNPRFVKPDEDKTNFTRPNRISFRDVFLILGAQNDREIYGLVAPDGDMGIIQWLHNAFVSEHYELDEDGNKRGNSRNRAEAAERIAKVITSPLLELAIAEELAHFRVRLQTANHRVGISDPMWEKFEIFYRRARLVENAGKVVRLYIYSHIPNIRGRLEFHAVLARMVAKYRLGRNVNTTKTEMEYIRAMQVGSQLMRSLRAAFNDAATSPIRAVFKSQVVALQTRNFDSVIAQVAMEIQNQIPDWISRFNKDVISRIRGTKGEPGMLYTNQRNNRSHIACAKESKTIVLRQATKDVRRVPIASKIFRQSHSMFICPYSIPENKKAGVLPVATTYAKFSLNRSPQPIKNFLLKFGDKIKMISDDYVAEYDPHTIVIQINFIPYARVDRAEVPAILFEALEARRHVRDRYDYAVPRQDEEMDLIHDHLPWDTSVYYSHGTDTLNFDTDAGSVLVPLLRVSTIADPELHEKMKVNGLVKGIFTKAKSREEYLDALKSRTKWHELEEKGWIEYYTLPMIAQSIVAYTAKDYLEDPSRYTHIALPSTFISSALSANPLPNRMRSVRGSLMYSHQSGANSHMTPELMSSDRGLDRRQRLVGGERALFSSPLFRAYNQSGIFSFQQSVSCLLAATGTNQEDGQILNREVAEFGCYATQSFSTISMEQGIVPGAKTVLTEDVLRSLDNPEEFDHMRIGADKADVVGSKLYHDSPMFCKFSERGGIYRDRSERYGQPDNSHSRFPIPGRVAYVHKDRLTIQTISPIEAGDKVSAFANKTTVNVIREPWEMPRTENGVIFSCVVNPDVVLRRETHSYPIGAFLSTVAAYLGKPITFDSFEHYGENVFIPLFKYMFGADPEAPPAKEDMTKNVQDFYKAIVESTKSETDDFSIYRRSPFEGTKFTEAERDMMVNGLKITTKLPKGSSIFGPVYHPELRGLTSAGLVHCVISMEKHPHQAAMKAHARDISDQRHKITWQATRSQKQEGGDKVGPMERSSLMSHGISVAIKDTFTERGSGRDYYFCARCSSYSCYRRDDNKVVCPRCGCIPEHEAIQHFGPTSVRNLGAYMSSLGTVLGYSK